MIVTNIKHAEEISGSLEYPDFELLTKKVYQECTEATESYALECVEEDLRCVYDMGRNSK